MPVHSARKDSERLQRETSQGVLLEEGWWLPRGCGRHCPRHATAVGTEQGAEQEYVLRLAVSPAGMQTSGLCPLSPCLLKQTGPWRGPVSPWSPQEWQAARSGSVGPEPRVQGSSCQPASGMDAMPLCWRPYVNVFMRCGRGDSLLAEGSLQKL